MISNIIPVSINRYERPCSISEQGLAKVGGEGLADKKMGRPTDNPKPNKVTIRMDNDTLEKLDNYCRYNDIERSEGIRRAIHKLDDKK